MGVDVGVDVGVVWGGCGCGCGSVGVGVWVWECGCGCECECGCGLIGQYAIATSCCPEMSIAELKSKLQLEGQQRGLEF